MKDSNPYLSLMDLEGEEDHPVRHRAPKETAPAEVPQDVEVPEDSQESNPYISLIEAEGESLQPNLKEQAVRDVLSSTAGILGSNISAGAPTVAETIAGAPAGSVREIRELVTPGKVRPTVSAAAKAAAEARVPPVAPVPSVVKKAAPASAGAKWGANWANMEMPPEFVGGVPEAAQMYQRGKPSGKITGRLAKKFGPSPALSIQGHTAKEVEQAAKQMLAIQAQQQIERQAAEEAAQRAAQVEQQAARSGFATKMAGPLGWLGKVVGGAGAGLGLYDAYRRQHEGDIHGATVGALGTAASVAPAVIGSYGVLPALGAAAPLYLMAHDRLKYLQEHPEAFQEPETVNGMRFDPMGNPYPAP